MNPHIVESVSHLGVFTQPRPFAAGRPFGQVSPKRPFKTSAAYLRREPQAVSRPDAGSVQRHCGKWVVSSGRCFGRRSYRV